MSEDKTQDTVEEEKVGPGAYIALLAALVFFSGIFYKIDGYKWLGALDFTTLAGAFGQISGKTFVGSGGCLLWGFLKLSRTTAPSVPLRN